MQVFKLEKKNPPLWGTGGRDEGKGNLRIIPKKRTALGDDGHQHCNIRRGGVGLRKCR